jgi:hypothetical protein
VGNLKAGVSGAWTKAKGDYDSYLASQDGESRLQRRRQEIMNLAESVSEKSEKLAPPVSLTTKFSTDDLRVGAPKRPATSEGATMPALKKRSVNSKKLKKQTSLGKLGFHRKPSISETVATSPTVTSIATVQSARPPPTPVYRATAGFADIQDDDGIRSRIQSLETEVSTLRAKLRWFEQSYGEIPVETLAEIQNSVINEQPRKQRRSVFKEELGTVTSRDSFIGDESILPREIKELKGTVSLDHIGPIAEEAEASPERFIPPESTIKLIQPSPSTKSIVSPPASPSKKQYSSPVKVHRSPPMSPSASPRKNIDLLETLSPIHPNLIPALIPRQSHPDMSKENLHHKVYEYVE